jgi:hypothetical protein
VIFTYEAVKDRLVKERNREVSDYTKMNIDREILSLLNRVTPIIMEKCSINRFLSLNEKTLDNAMQSHTPLAFYLATDWKYSENQFADLLTNGLIYDNLSLDERNIFIRLIKAIRPLEYATDPKFYFVQGKPTSQYIIAKGNDIDPSTKLENRYLLLKKTRAPNQFVVKSFNDINKGKYKVDLLSPLKAGKHGRLLLIECCLEISKCITDWRNSRGNEFLLDDRNFRFGKKRKSKRVVVDI